MFDLDLDGLGLPHALALGMLTWLVHIPRGDAGVADSFWSLYFLAMASVYALSAAVAGERAVLVVFLVALWAVRLSAYVTRRTWGRPEDRRHAAMRVEYAPGFWWKRIYLVFGLQPVLAWIISLPDYIARTNAFLPGPPHATRRLEA